MREPILMPTLSDTMESGQLVEWLKQPGDAIKKGEVIAQVETDKAVMDLEAFHDGYLAGPLAAAQSEQPVGAVIGYITDSAEKAKAEPASVEKKPAVTKPAPASVQPVSDSKKEPNKETNKEPQKEIKKATEKNTQHSVTDKAEPLASQPTQPTPLAKASGNAATPASPYARGLARELGLDLSLVAPGPDGVVRASQVMAAALNEPQPNLDDGPAYQLQSMTPMQRAVANNMSAAAATPVFRISSRLSLEPLSNLAHRDKRSLTLLLARACALTVAAHPRFNAVYTAKGLAQRHQVDVGIAVDVANGLLTPVLRDVGGRPLDELAEDWRVLKDRATGKLPRRRLTPEDYRGATFYLSNLGMFDAVAHFDAVVPLGAAAILAVAAVQDGKAEFTLSCDHRVVYGADAARFLATLAEFLGKPDRLSATTQNNK